MADMKSSWDGALKGSGMEVFAKLFAGPDGGKIKDKHFPDMGDLSSDKGKAHVSNVFNGIQKMIDSIDKPGDMDALKKDFIQKHKARGVSAAEIDRMKDAFGAVLDAHGQGGKKGAWGAFLDDLKKSL